MAKLRGPLLSFGAIGRFGKNLVIRRHGKDHIAETYPHPRDAKTPAQLSWRHMYQKAVALWHALSDEEKADWERQATPRHMTGYAWFLSQCLKPNPGIYLPLQGGSMQGAVAMNFNRITTLPPPGHAQDPARQAELTAHQALTKSVHGLKGEIGFSAYATSDQTIPPSTWTKIAFPAVEWDVGEYFDLVNYRHHPLIPGKYLYASGVRFINIDDGRRANLYIFKNGVSSRELARQIPGSTGAVFINGLSIMPMNGTTDYVEIRVWHNNPDSRDVLGLIQSTWFQGSLVAQT